MACRLGTTPVARVSCRLEDLQHRGESKLTTNDYLFTSESVSEGHPDKVSDRISDAVVDAYLAADPLSRVACETLTTTNRIVLAGEIRGPEDLHPSRMEDVARHACLLYTSPSPRD